MTSAFFLHYRLKSISSTIKTGVWAYIFLLVSVAVASPTVDGEEDQPPRSLLSKFTSAESFKNILPTFVRSDSKPSPTLTLDTIDLAQYFGYDAERHTITTQDGYILEVHRIYSNAATGTSTANPVVVVHHAFLLNSREFLTLGPKKALGYLLADAGFDVWLCNARGNSYSRKHTTLSPDQKEFWDFSYTEHGMYDIPAVIDYALSVTGRSKVHYIGHSIGTISFFIMGSKRPDMLSKVQSFTGLAPITTAKNGRSGVLKSIMKNYDLIARGFEQIGAYEFLAHKKWLKTAGNTVCQEGWLTQRLCTAFIFALNGYNPAQMSASLLPEMLTHSPSGSSLKTFRHFGQNYFNGFREYDYGTEGNLAQYDSPEPPMFDLSRITVPSQLYFGINDLMADYMDTIQICKTLPNVYRCEAVDDELFNHIDFVWALNAATLVYPKVIDGLKHLEK